MAVSKVALFAAASLALVGAQIFLVQREEAPERPIYPKVDETPYLRELREKWEAEREVQREKITEQANPVSFTASNPFFKAYNDEKRKVEKSDPNFQAALLEYQYKVHAHDAVAKGPKYPPQVVGQGALGAAALVAATASVGLGRFACFAACAATTAVLVLTLPTRLNRGVFDFSDLGCVNMGVTYGSALLTFWLTCFYEGAPAPAKAKAA